MTCAARLVSFAKIACANECCVALLEEAGGERAAKAVNTPAGKYTQVQKHRVRRAMVTYETVANTAISGNAVQSSDPQGCAAAQRPREQGGNTGAPDPSSFGQLHSAATCS